MRPTVLLAACLTAFAQDAPFHSAELIFPLEKWHNHASCLVELPNGELLVVWYHGSGERNADDVVVEAARLARGAASWSPRFTIADTPGFPDTNPAVFVDSRRRLWLLWPVILANEWHTALMKFKISSDYQSSGVPKWEREDNLLFVPRNFASTVKQIVEPVLASTPPGPRADYLREMLRRAADKYFSRMGWMTRAHPLELPSGRILVPLYSDGYSFAIVAHTDDGGVHWSSGEPMVGAGSIQPSIVRRRDGTLVAYMRDNGPPPKRVHISTSKDAGVTWSRVEDTEIPNPGAGMETIALADGTWAMIYNDTEKGRDSLAVSLSDDEGRTWKWTRHLEKQPGQFHYPSLMQAADGSLHVSYSYFVAEGKAIKHARFNVTWVKQGDAR
jgi:predicted neuraminidase